MKNKYTQSEERKIWTNMIDDGIFSFLDIVKKINFDDYQYRGPCTIRLMEEQESVVEKKHIIEEIITEEVINIESEKGATYELFGGICYDILDNDNKYKKTNKKNILDSTGDIDVRVFLPGIKEESYTESDVIKKFFVSNADSKSVVSKYNDERDKRINPFIMDFIMYVYSELQKNITNDMIKSIFPRCGAINDKDVQNIINECEMVFSYEKLGDTGILVCHKENDMLKIQFILKADKYLDHVIEFVLVLSEAVLSIDSELVNFTKSRGTMNTGGFKIQDIPELLSENYKAYQERVEYIGDKKYTHKCINHVARILYLFILLEKNPELLRKYKIQVISLTQSFINDILKSGKKYIVFYRIDVNGVFEIKKIAVEMLLKAFSSILPEKYFLGILRKPLNYDVKSDAYKDLMSIINTNSFNVYQKSRRNSKSKKSKRTISSLRNSSRRKGKKEYYSI